jgi:hypothetical protein
MGSPLFCIFIPFTVPQQGHREKEPVADGALKPHTMLMITAIDEGTGIVIVLDVLAEAYDAMEAVVTGILESFRFEN